MRCIGSAVKRSRMHSVMRRHRTSRRCSSTRRICFRMVVRDNGCGMDPDMLQSVVRVTGDCRNARALDPDRCAAQGPERPRRGYGEMTWSSPADSLRSDGPRRWADWLGRLYLRGERR